MSGASSVTVSLTGASSASITTDASGNYSFTGLANGSYTVTPSKAGYTFSPASLSPTVNGGNVTGQDFAATWQGFSISGNVSGASSVTVSLSGTSSASTTTDASGNYSFTGLANGSYTITPSKGGHTFSPATLSPTVNDANVTGQDFAATWTGYRIYGTVTGASSVTVSLTGASSASTTTDAAGNYSFTGLANGGYTVTPSKPGYTFSPASLSPTVSDADVTGQSFAATWKGFSISGTVSGAFSVAVSLSGTSSASTTTDAGGNYSFTGLANGSYTVTPSKAGYTFSPASLSPTVNDASVTGQSFVATWTGFSISGTVSGASSVTVSLAGPSSASTTTDASGGYSFTGLSNGSYTVTPRKDGYTFSPASLSPVVNGANATGQSFVATWMGFSISGYVSGAVLSGVTITLAGMGSATATTDALGHYEFTGLANGGYTVTPNKDEYTFTPVSNGVTVNNANVVQNFAAVDAEWTHWAGSAADSPLTGNYTVDVAAGIVTDNVTGLVWQRGGSSQGFYGAVQYCQLLNLGGWSSGWRLPTVIELESIVDYGTSSPSINSAVFPGTPTGVQTQWYWSSSPWLGAAGSGRGVSFFRGETGRLDRNYIYSVRCVR